MRRTITLTILILWVLNSFSQEFGTHWVSCPLPNDSSEVLFRKVYRTEHRPQQALLTFASAGALRVYVNERNITQDVFFENRDTSVITSHTIDISGYLYPDSNVIAIWYAPAKSKVISKQLSLEYYGRDIRGNRFYHQADPTWLCRKITGCSAKVREYYNGSRLPEDWKSIDCHATKWTHPVGCLPQEKDFIVEENRPGKDHFLHMRTLSPVSWKTQNEGLLIDFGHPFTGTIRLTLRDAKKGERIQFGDSHYTCSGELDEQAFRHFTTGSSRYIFISGDSNFKPSQIRNAEALEYAHTTYTNFQ
jgi:hypothetical protein